MSDNTNMGKKADMFLEVCFEVVNKVGGIYTVVKSKAKYMKNYYGDNYIAIGPAINKNQIIYEFKEEEWNEWKDIVDKMSRKGVKIKTGRWKIEGNVRTILIDFSQLFHKKNEIKAKLWERWGIDSLRAGYDFEEPMLFGYAAGMLIEEIKNKFKSANIVAQFHEWMSSVGLLYLKEKKIKVGKVFTTHATMLGRAMASSMENFHEFIWNKKMKNQEIDPILPYRYNVEAKHLVERASAHQADVFTTVSETVNDECKVILGKEADMLLYNGLNMEKYPDIEELSYIHKKNKEKIMDFIRAYFMPYYPLNINKNSRAIFLSGRYEFKNKGIDLFIDALARLNDELKREGRKEELYVFLFVPTGIKGEKTEVLENVLTYESLKEHAKKASKEVITRIIKEVNEKGIIEGKNLKWEMEALQEINKVGARIVHMREQNLSPSLSAFELSYPETKDPIISYLNSRGLKNRKEDKVKVIFYPAYLSASDRLLAMDYTDVIRGCSAGIFPSYYESWGYTPLEAMSNGLVAVTSDLTGFARFLYSHLPQEDINKGIYIIKRAQKKYDESVEELKEVIKKIMFMSKMDIAREKHKAKEISYMCDWKEFSKRYIMAHNLALEKINQ